MGGDTVDVLFIGLDDGSVHISIYDSFEVGVFDLGTAEERLKGCQPLMHASHSGVCTHVLLVEAASCICLVPVDLPFLFNAGEYLSLLAAKSTELQNLLRYIHQVQRMIHLEWKASQELPARFNGSIENTLKEENLPDFVNVLYHLAVTGHCLPAVKEWLVDILSERVREQLLRFPACIMRLKHEAGI